MGVLEEFLAGLEGFEWDAGNSDKNWHDHLVRQAEAEQVLLNRPVVCAADLKHTRTEARFFTLGRTDSGRHLAIVFTTRGKLVRVISARPMSRAERRAYGQVEARSQTDS
jgi:uncharacterized DUF497 family protein